MENNANYADAYLGMLKDKLFSKVVIDDSVQVDLI
jgi:hypothetical protein